MNIVELTNIIENCVNDIVFQYNGKQCGVTSEVHNYVPTFQVWYGENTKEYSHVEDVITDKFYNDKSLAELLCSDNGVRYSVL